MSNVSRNARKIIEDINKGLHGNPQQWRSGHIASWLSPRNEQEKFIKGAIQQLALSSDLGMVDGLFRDHWADNVSAARMALAYDCGRLDRGTLDSYICALCAHVGYDVCLEAWDEDRFSEYREEMGY